MILQFYILNLEVLSLENGRVTGVKTINMRLEKRKSKSLRIKVDIKGLKLIVMDLS